MKLLNKNEVQTFKASERKTEIDVGMALARRVDDLRELTAKEENNLNKFRTETVKIVQKDVDDLIKHKEELEYEIGVLDRQNKNLNRPFDEEWELVKMKRISDLDDKLENLERREKDLVKGEFLYSFRENDLKLLEERAKDESNRSERMLKEASIAKEEAHDLVVEAKLKEARISSEIDAKTNEYKTKEIEWLTKEKDLSMREEALRRSVRELARREKFINDKYRTYSRMVESMETKSL